jgi:hypothetical protein
MAAPDQEYRSLMLRKVKQVAESHGGIMKIPRSVQKKLGFDVVSARGGHVYISIKAPGRNADKKIQNLEGELSAEKAFSGYKPAPDMIMEGALHDSIRSPCMEDFWLQKGWYREDEFSLHIINAKWAENPEAGREAMRFLVRKVLCKDPSKVSNDDIFLNGLMGLITTRYQGRIWLALLDAGLISDKEAEELSKRRSRAK